MLDALAVVKIPRIAAAPNPGRALLHGNAMGGGVEASC
jgi:hypothetical protein